MAATQFTSSDSWPDASAGVHRHVRHHVRQRECVDEGTIVLFRPLSGSAAVWIQEHVDPQAQWFGGSLVVEHRYAPAMVGGMLRDDLHVRR